MLSIYTTEDIISAIYKDGDDKYTAWYDLITKTRPILKVLLGENTDYDTDDYNPVYMLEKDHDINVEPEYTEDVGENSYLASVVNMQQNSVADPCAVFILDVDKETAKQISDKYGIICHSFGESPITNPLFQESIEKDVDKAENNRGWHELILRDATVPSNSLVFIDRYLFSHDSGNITSQDGVENVFTILDKALPLSLGVDYHVLLVFDASTVDKVDTFERISTQVNNLKRRLNRPYNITIETVSISSDDFNYDETHNRRILSNYFIIRVDRSLKAFRGTKSLYTQSLWLDWAASKGVVRQLRSDAPAKALYKYIKEVRSAIAQLKKSLGNVSFTQNGNPRIAISNISHRLLQI